jgi:hypothetical protein
VVVTARRRVCCVWRGHLTATSRPKRK